MDQSQLTLVEQYRKKLYRIAWRIQYRARVQTNHEFVMEKNESVSTIFYRIFKLSYVHITAYQLSIF